MSAYLVRQLNAHMIFQGFIRGCKVRECFLEGGKHVIGIIAGRDLYLVASKPDRYLTQQRLGASQVLCRSPVDDHKWNEFVHIPSTGNIESFCDFFAQSQIWALISLKELNSVFQDRSFCRYVDRKANGRQGSQRKSIFSPHCLGPGCYPNGASECADSSYRRDPIRPFRNAHLAPRDTLISSQAYGSSCDHDCPLLVPSHSTSRLSWRNRNTVRIGGEK